MKRNCLSLTRMGFTPQQLAHSLKRSQCLIKTLEETIKGQKKHKNQLDKFTRNLIAFNDWVKEILDLNLDLNQASEPTLSHFNLCQLIDQMYLFIDHLCLWIKSLLNQSGHSIDPLHEPHFKPLKRRLIDLLNQMPHDCKKDSFGGHYADHFSALKEMIPNTEILKRLLSSLPSLVITVCGFILGSAVMGAIIGATMGKAAVLGAAILVTAGITVFPLSILLTAALIFSSAYFLMAIIHAIDGISKVISTALSRKRFPEKCCKDYEKMINLIGAIDHSAKALKALQEPQKRGRVLSFFNRWQSKKTDMNPNQQPTLSFIVVISAHP